MKILITGGAGFIGINSAKSFLERKEKVILVDNLSRNGSKINLGWLTNKYPGSFKFFEGDLRDESFLKEVFLNCGELDAVLHLAAQVAVTTSVLNPREDFEINAWGTFNVLEAVRQYQAENPPLVIYSSTNKVYGAMEGIAIVERNGRYEYKDLPFGVGENRILDFHSPYGCSKGAADEYVIDYSRIYGIPTVTFRQSCIYGYHQFGVEDQGWVAWFTIAAGLKKPITIYGDGKQVRDILFVDDLIDLYELAIENRERLNGESFNIGGGSTNQISLLELLGFLEELLGKNIPVSYGDWRPGDQKVFVSDIRRAQSFFGWKPKTSVEQGVRMLYEWIMTNRDLFANVQNVR